MAPEVIEESDECNSEVQTSGTWGLQSLWWVCQCVALHAPRPPHWCIKLEHLMQRVLRLHAPLTSWLNHLGQINDAKINDGGKQSGGAVVTTCAGGALHQVLHTHIHVLPHTCDGVDWAQMVTGAPSHSSLPGCEYTGLGGIGVSNFACQLC